VTYPVLIILQGFPKNGDQTAKPPLERFAVRRGDRTLLIPVDAVEWIGSSGDYVTLWTEEGSYLLRHTLQALEGELDPRFVRIHRCAIARLDRIVEMRPHQRGACDLVMRGGSNLRVSRRYRQSFQAALLGQPKTGRP
jgi:two-component system, LytTR family, response regulator